MTEVLVPLLPLIIGSALVPVQIIMVILMLTSARQGPLKAIAFVTGMTLVRIAQGILFGLVLTGGDSAESADKSGWVKAALLLVLGILLLVNAYRTYAKVPDSDAPPPKWLTMLERVSPIGALGMGAGWY